MMKYLRKKRVILSVLKKRSEQLPSFYEKSILKAAYFCFCCFIFYGIFQLLRMRMHLRAEELVHTNGKGPSRRDRVEKQVEEKQTGLKEIQQRRT